jgi:hypothetical protein
MRIVAVMVAAAVLAGLSSAISDAASAGTATSAWVVRANSTCRAMKRKYKPETAWIAKIGQHPTRAQMRRMLNILLSAERDLYQTLKAIPGRRPTGADRALAFAAIDIEELARAIAAFDRGNMRQFLRLWKVWSNDDRANRLFRAIGATDCA